MDKEKELEPQNAEVVEENVEAPEAETEETEQTAETERKPRELFFERVRTNFPEGRYDEDEEEYYKNAMQMFDDYETDAEDVRGKMANLFQRFESDPAAAATMADFLEGAPLPVALKRYFNDDELQVREGDDYYEDYKKAGEERTKHKKEIEAMVSEIQKNSSESEKNFKEYADENGLSEEDAEEIWNNIEELANNLSKGLYSKDFLKMMHKGRNYDSDVAAANKAGEVKGRNEKIVEKLERPKGDGLPEPGAGGSKAETKTEDINPAVAKFKELASRRSKWDM